MGLFLGNRLVSPAQIVNGGGSGSGDNSVDCKRVIDNNGNVSMPSTDFTFAFPSTATAITGNYVFKYMFENNSHITAVDASSITSISGDFAFDCAFWGAENLVTANFQNLTTVSGNYAFNNAFRFSGLTTVSFPKLEYILDDAFSLVFGYCRNLQSVSFGGLKASTMGNVTYPFGGSNRYAFSNCNSLTEIHFRADAKSKIQSLIGYADKWGASNATIYFDIAGVVITFDITPAVGNAIYLGGELVSGTTAYTDLDNKIAVISNNSYPLVVKHYTNLQSEQVITSTIDLTQANTGNYIEIQPSEPGCTVKFYIDGVEYNPTSVVGNNSRLTLDVDSSVSVGYKVTKSGYLDATGTVTFNNAIVTETVTMQVDTSRTVTLQYPFTTDRSYLQNLIYDSSEGWNNYGYVINNNYEAIIDSNYDDYSASGDICCNGYITFTTGSSPSTLLVNAGGDGYGDYGVWISTVGPQEVYDYAPFYDDSDPFGDGGEWLFKCDGISANQDYSKTLQANTTYYISFLYYIYQNGGDEDDYEQDPGFKINKIQFDVVS